MPSVADRKPGCRYDGRRKGLLTAKRAASRHPGITPAYSATRKVEKANHETAGLPNAGARGVKSNTSLIVSGAELVVLS